MKSSSYAEVLSIPVLIKKYCLFAGWGCVGVNRGHQGRVRINFLVGGRG